jgi:broad specificity phosphatase PhoE
VTTFFLVRHAVHSLGSDSLAGRSPEVRLTPDGLAQAERLGERLSREALTAVHASPQQRTVETAEAIARRCGLAVETFPELDEVDFGDWSGKTFAQLEADPHWTLWNTQRETATTPGGEGIEDVAKRVANHLTVARREHPAGRIAIVSHAEIIRTAILQALGLPYSAFTRIRVDPASISRLEMEDFEATLAGLNETVRP